jgi:ribosome-associated toxin RatA of RatAB toxin-antitoxin module
MTDQSIQSISIAAAPAQVMAVIADFAAYPQWARSIKAVDVLQPGSDSRAELVRFRIDAGVLKDTYELRYQWDGDRSVQWQLVSSDVQKAQHGSYTLAAAGTEGTEVTYSLSVDLAMPMLGLLKRKAERVVMDTALKELKKRVESGG